MCGFNCEQGEAGTASLMCMCESVHRHTPVNRMVTDK